MKYIDSMLFIYGAINTDEIGEKTREVIKEIRKGKEEAITSTLTYDEVFWKVKKEKNHEQALKIGKSLLKMNNLRFQRVDNKILWRAQDQMKRYKLDPRDAIHLACALKKEVYAIISEDKGFDRVKGINREWI